MKTRHPEFSRQLEAGLYALQIHMEERNKTKLLDFVYILLKWNKVYNLTAIVDFDEIITHHLLDSLSIVPYIEGDEVLDLGSGAGFPGIPCALALPDKKFTLLDSNGKKTRFLTQVVAELKLANVVVVQGRAQDYRPAQCFETVMTRAFATLDKVIHCTKHLLCSQGSLLVMKGRHPHAELQNIDKHATVYPLQVPGLNEQRHLICVKG